MGELCQHQGDDGDDHTSIELNGLPLYASANSFATVGSLNFMTTIERFGAESLVGLANRS